MADGASLGVAVTRVYSGMNVDYAKVDGVIKKINDFVLNLVLTLQDVSGEHKQTEALQFEGRVKGSRTRSLESKVYFSNLQPGGDYFLFITEGKVADSEDDLAKGRFAIRFR